MFGDRLVLCTFTITYVNYIIPNPIFLRTE